MYTNSPIASAATTIATTNTAIGQRGRVDTARGCASECPRERSRRRLSSYPSPVGGLCSAMPAWMVCSSSRAFSASVFGGAGFAAAALLRRNCDSGSAGTCRSPPQARHRHADRAAGGDLTVSRAEGLAQKEEALDARLEERERVGPVVRPRHHQALAACGRHHTDSVGGVRAAGLRPGNPAPVRGDVEARGPGDEPANKARPHVDGVDLVVGAEGDEVRGRPEDVARYVRRSVERAPGPAADGADLRS